MVEVLTSGTWRRLNNHDLANFPILNLDYLKSLTVVIYQINLASLYIPDNY